MVATGPYLHEAPKGTTEQEAQALLLREYLKEAFYDGVSHPPGFPDNSTKVNDRALLDAARRVVQSGKVTVTLA